MQGNDMPLGYNPPTLARHTSRIGQMVGKGISSYPFPEPRYDGGLTRELPTTRNT